MHSNPPLQQEQKPISQQSQHSILPKISKIKKSIVSQTCQQKSSTPKITTFFKKLNPTLSQQKSYKSLSKIDMKKSTQQLIQLEILKDQEKDLNQQELQLRLQLDVLRNQSRMVKEQYKIFTKKVKYAKIHDIKQRYSIIRQQKRIPSYEKMLSFQASLTNSQQNTPTNKISLQVKEIQDRYVQKQKYFQQNVSKLSLIQKMFMQKQLQQLRTQLKYIGNLNDAYNQKQHLCIKQQSCKFNLLNWPLLQKKYQVLQLIGHGGYSEVYLGLNILTYQKVAIKLCSVSQMSQISSNIYLKHLFRQFQTHKHLQNDNIVSLYQVIQQGHGVFCMILEYCDGLELSKYLKHKHTISQQQVQAIMFQIFQALYYLNRCGKKIIHFDLKPQNIMFHKGLIKILDFGLTKHLDDQNSRAALTSYGMGTYVYLPPQCRENSDNQLVLTSKIDIWSAGIIFYQLLTGQRPNNNSQYQIDKLCNNISQQTIQLIKKCLKINPNQRISPKQIYFNSYFNQFQRKFAD